MRSVLKWLAALWVASFLFLILGLFLVGMLVGAFSSNFKFEQSVPEVKSGMILVVRLDMNLVDSPELDDPFRQVSRSLGGEYDLTVPLREALRGLDRVKTDDRIKGILLVGQWNRQGYGTSLASLQEFRAKLLEVKAGGKPIMAYLDSDGLAELYTKSVADELWMNPYGQLDFKGLGSETIYWGGAFDRFGLGVQLIRAGKYKSAGESFVASEMSLENRQQLSALLDDLWLDLREDLSGSLGVGKSALAELADLGVILPEELLFRGVVDELLYMDEVLDRVIAVGEADPQNNSFRQISFEDYLSSTVKKSGFDLDLSGDNEVAVVYAEGIIVEGRGELGYIGGDALARKLRAIRNDDSVKAVVLRVNSPGGSATASEKILREIELINATKPVVVSMGGMAASGGYWISSQADTIFAEPTTITGSIGVFSMIPNVEGVLENYDLNVERVETNEAATMWSITRPRTEAEVNRLQRMVDHTYDAFLKRVSEGRGMTVEAADAIAQGRVWTGRRAEEIGLVDRIGGLEDAIAYAAESANLGVNYRVVDHPRRLNLQERLNEMFERSASLFGFRGLRWSDQIESAGFPVEELEWLRSLNDSHHIYSYNPHRIQW